MTATDFFPGMKVSLGGEYGVVTSDFTEWDGIYFVNGEKIQGNPSKQFGLIRWDTDKESDTEDWTGLFGSFIDSGGIEVSSTHQFEFINDDGTVKLK